MYFLEADSLGCLSVIQHEPTIEQDMTGRCGSDYAVVVMFTNNFIGLHSKVLSVLFLLWDVKGGCI